MGSLLWFFPALFSPQGTSEEMLQSLALMMNVTKIINFILLYLQYSIPRKNAVKIISGMQIKITQHSFSGTRQQN